MIRIIVPISDRVEGPTVRISNIPRMLTRGLIMQIDGRTRRNTYEQRGEMCRRYIGNCAILLAIGASESPPCTSR